MVLLVVLVWWDAHAQDAAGSFSPRSRRRLQAHGGKTVICNLHTLDTARAYCDRVIGMHAGEIVFDGSPDELTFEKSREIYGAGDAFNEATTSTSLTAPAAASPVSAPSVGAVAAGH